jgi:GNAT superfamily N-acetyltransferase
VPSGQHRQVVDAIVRLSVDDIKDCLALAEDRAWVPEEHKWRMLFALGSVFGVRDAAGTLIGVVVLTRFGNDLAAIGMLLVATRSGGQGIGRRLMTHALDAAGDAVVFLNATESGRPLYEKLGFIATSVTSTYVGRYAPADGPPRSRLCTQSDLPAILALDTRAIGAERRLLVELLPTFTEHLRVMERDDGITGYAGAWRNVDTVIIGPVIAESLHDAQALIADVALHFDEPVRLDLDARHPQLHVWAQQHGAVLRGASTVMVLGGRPLPGDRSHWFLPLMQALG